MYLSFFMSRSTFSPSLSDYIWKQSHVSRALDGGCELALALCRYAGALSRDETAIRVDKFLHYLRVLVIDESYVVFSEVTFFFHCFFE